MAVARKIVYRRRKEQNTVLIKLSYVALSCTRWTRFKAHIFRQVALKYAWRAKELLSIIRSWWCSQRWKTITDVQILFFSLRVRFSLQLYAVIRSNYLAEINVAWFNNIFVEFGSISASKYHQTNLVHFNSSNFPWMCASLLTRLSLHKSVLISCKFPI